MRAWELNEDVHTVRRIDPSEYGGWITPTNEVIHVPFEGHEVIGQKLGFKASSGRLIREVLLNKGYVRFVTNGEQLGEVNVEGTVDALKRTYTVWGRLLKDAQWLMLDSVDRPIEIGEHKRYGHYLDISLYKNKTDVRKVFSKSLDESDAPLTDADLEQIEEVLDKLWASLGIDIAFSTHWKERVNDPRNQKQITAQEIIKIFNESLKRYGKKIAQAGPDFEAVLKDVSTDINIPFVLHWDRENQELDLVAKTIMRKPDFTSPNPELVVGLTTKKRESVNELKVEEDVISEYKVTKVYNRDLEEVKVLLNPSPEQFMILLKRAPYKAMRGLARFNGKETYVWNASQMMHLKMVEALQIKDQMDFQRFHIEIDRFGSLVVYPPDFRETKAFKKLIDDSRIDYRAKLYGLGESTSVFEAKFYKMPIKDPFTQVPTELNIYVNPTRNEFLTLMEKNASGELRGLLKKDDSEILIWDAFRATHYTVYFYLGLNSQEYYDVGFHDLGDGKIDFYPNEVSNSKFYQRYFGEGIVEDRQKGKSLPEMGYRGEHVIVYRAVLQGKTTLESMDYVTRSLKFAKKHAEHNASIEGEDSVVLRSVVKASNVYEAYNPGEYFYDGPAVKGKISYIAKPE